MNERRERRIKNEEKGGKSGGMGMGWGEMFKGILIIALVW